jgi:hypothetical protein
MKQNNNHNVLNTGKMDYFDYGLKGVTDVNFARNQFFAAFRILVPEAFEDLLDILPVFSQIYNHITEDRKKSKIVSLRDIQSMTTQKNDEFVQFLQEWGRNYNVSEDFWLLNEIPKNLSMWIRFEKYKKETYFRYLGDDYPLEMERQLASNMRSIMTPEKAQRYAQLNNELKTYIDMPMKLVQFEKQFYDLLKEYSQLNKEFFVKSKAKRNFDHFNWLVHSYIQKLSHEEISVMYHVGGEDPIRIIRKQVNNLIDTIGLKKKRPGRPKI